MKKAIVVFSALLIIAGCKTKKKTTETGSKKNETATKAGAKTAIGVAQKRWPGTSQADLDAGKHIYETRCTTCHAAKNIVTRDEENWKKNIDKMAPRAKLTAEEKDKLTRYILSYREANTTTE